MTEDYSTTIRFLEPRAMRLRSDTRGKLVLEVEGEKHEGVHLSRAFPHTAPHVYISVADSEGKEIGVIEDLAGLDHSSREAAEEELSLAYFSPVIDRIRKVTQHYGATSWHVDTDRGPQVLRVRERGDIRWLSAQEVIFTDVHGVRYQIPDVTVLDDESRFLLEQET